MFAPRRLLALALAGAVATATGCKGDEEAQSTASPSPPAAAALPPPVQPARTPSSDLGGALYVNHCQACHGPAGEGGMGPTLRGVGARLEPAALVRVVTLGRPGQGMPALGTRLTSGEIDAVVAYLRTL